VHYILTKEPHINEQHLKTIWILGTVTIVVIFFILGFYYYWVWLLWLPISFGILAAYQALSEHFFSTELTCPTCGSKVKLESNFCFHCGFKLIKKCPNCDFLNKYDQLECQSCGSQLPSYNEYPTQEKDTAKYVGTLPQGINFCPNCGRKLKKFGSDEPKRCSNCKTLIQRY
jgi:DNA-directed RNA polymerase subunit RPC12/RpoP